MAASLPCPRTPAKQQETLSEITQDKQKRRTQEQQHGEHDIKLHNKATRTSGEQRDGFVVGARRQRNPSGQRAHSGLTRLSGTLHMAKQHCEPLLPARHNDDCDHKQVATIFVNNVKAKPITKRQTQDRGQRTYASQITHLFVEEQGEQVDGGCCDCLLRFTTCCLGLGER